MSYFNTIIIITNTYWQIFRLIKKENCFYHSKSMRVVIAWAETWCLMIRSWSLMCFKEGSNKQYVVLSGGMFDWANRRRNKQKVMK